MKIGAFFHPSSESEFTLWAPFADQIHLQLSAPKVLSIPMKKQEKGYWTITASARPGTRYRYRINQSSDFPDPASFFQPDGVHGNSELIDHGAFAWTDSAWAGIPLATYIIYELHVGTFTPEGTFASIIERLDDLKKTGITAIEIMPIHQFPGTRNWGYDGAYLFAVQNSYGGPHELKKLINACHCTGLAVILDVVYNHFGPEGNYLSQFGPYFTDKYKTPWGSAVNFDDAYAYGVRNFILENTRYWFELFHIDALRIDAIHGIFDFSARHILEDMSCAATELSDQCNRPCYLIAESDLNDSRVIRPRSRYGFGIDAQWSDDFHHSVHALLTNERHGYYQDFGSVDHLTAALNEGFTYGGRFSSFRKRYHGNDASDLPLSQFVVCTQNHDQVGNRAAAERESRLMSFEQLKLAAGILITAPYIPLLFMGQEYGEQAPFNYFIDHSDPELIKAVRSGRQEEFKAFSWKTTPPDPKDPATFQASRLDWNRRNTGDHALLLSWYHALLTYRKKCIILFDDTRKQYTASTIAHKQLIITSRYSKNRGMITVANFNKETVPFKLQIPENHWMKLFDSSEANWHGPGSTLPEKLNSLTEYTIQPFSFVLYEWRNKTHEPLRMHSRTFLSAAAGKSVARRS
ncbi:MAG: malto-oligosyltrehalose trehalohydrolase [Elusimicrobia bacterium]|nr:malto-oligosyltrehalose trehalohydrolase [Elusimicrobiota bacterium]MBD3411811.1 malto-oligosyltrehalose trehalohydrolase [Elusimicrobiota bacterium]